MRKPNVCLLWLNWNSMKIFDIVRRSLKAISRIDYDNLQVILIDNGSTDGSFEKIEKEVERIGLRADFVRNKENLGFGEGMNSGYRERGDVEYVFILNNDAIPTPRSIKKMVDFMENNKDVGAVQGILLRFDGNIDTAGDFKDELLNTVVLKRKIEKPIEISYADGAYCGYKVKVLEEIGLEEKLFPEEAFMFLNDNLLGLKIWDAGYRVFSLPFITGFHERGASFGRMNPRKIYYIIRDWLTLLYLSNSRKKFLYPMFLFRKIEQFILRRSLSFRPVFKGIRDARDLCKKLSFWKFDLYKAPHIKLNVINTFISLLPYRTFSNYILKKVVERKGGRPFQIF